MAEIQEVTLDQLPEMDSPDDAVIFGRKNKADYKLPASKLFSVKNNLSEGDAEKMRETLDVQSSKEVSAALTQLGETWDQSLESAKEEVNQSLVDAKEELNKAITDGDKASADALSEAVKELNKTIEDLKTDYDKKIALMSTFGNPLIGEVLEWPSAKMPQEIWTDLGMVFIPYMGQTFDALAYPQLALLHPELKLPFDPRGKFRRAWDNGAGVDPNRAINSAQSPTELRTGLQGYMGEDPNESSAAVGLCFAGEDTINGSYVPKFYPVGKSGNNANLTTATSPNQDNGILGTINQVYYAGSAGAATATKPLINWISTRPINYATNLIVRAK